MAQGPDHKRIEISVPSVYVKVDENVWEDLEKCLFQGFLTSRASVQGQEFVFKTLNHHELRNVEFCRPASDSSDRTVFRAAFIAHSVFMVNGNNALVDRPKHISRLIKTLSKIPSAVQDKILENLTALNERASRTYPLTEVYVHENRSRFRWLQTRDVPVCSPISTGTHGTDSLGMSHFQSTWTALNRILDRNEDMEREWSNAKFVGSCMAGKGMQSVDSRDKSRLEKERLEREEKRAQVLRAYLNRTVGGPVGRAGETMKLPDGRTAEIVGRTKAESVEELATQLTAALNNEKDSHDAVVEHHARKTRERMAIIALEQRKISVPRLAPPPPDGQSSYVLTGGRAEAVERMARLRRFMVDIDPEDSTEDGS